jgi:hypothetical protein
MNNLMGIGHGAWGIGHGALQIKNNQLFIWGGGLAVGVKVRTNKMSSPQYWVLGLGSGFYLSCN